MLASVQSLEQCWSPVCRADQTLRVSLKHSFFSADYTHCLTGDLVDAAIWALSVLHGLPLPWECCYELIFNPYSIETNVSIIIACVPTIKPLLSLAAQQFTTRTGRYSTPIRGYQRHTDIQYSNKPVFLGFAVEHNCASRVGGDWLEMTSQEATRKVETLEERNRSQQMQV